MKLLSLLVSLLIISTSCDKKSKIESPQTPSISVETKNSFPLNRVNVSDKKDIIKLREHVEILIENRMSIMASDLSDITYDQLYPSGILKNRKLSGIPLQNGYWVKFEKTYRYNYGQTDAVIGSGKYHYAESDDKLLMLDDDDRIEPKLWSVKSDSENFTFAGHPIIIIEGQDGRAEILLKNFSNDKFLTQQKILFNSNNGLQVLLNRIKE